MSALNYVTQISGYFSVSKIWTLLYFKAHIFSSMFCWPDVNIQLVFFASLQIYTQLSWYLCYSWKYIFFAYDSRKMSNCYVNINVLMTEIRKSTDCLLRYYMEYCSQYLPTTWCHIPEGSKLRIIAELSPLPCPSFFLSNSEICAKVTLHCVDLGTLSGYY
jgi:hypothetical protein